MQKSILLFLFITSFNILEGQNESQIKMKITMNGLDTLLIEKYDTDCNLIFKKDFQNWGENFIQTWNYSKGQLQYQIIADS